MKQKEKSIKFNLVMNMLLTTSAFLFPLITFPYITRVLQPEGNGKIAFANSVINYFSMFAMLGIPTYGIRACAQVRDDQDQLSKTAQEIWIINAVMTVLAYFALAAALVLVPRFREDRTLLLICSITLVLNLVAMEWVYKALECYTYITLRSLAFKVLAVALMFLLVHAKGDYVRYAGITVLANTGYGVFNLLNLQKHIRFHKYTDYHFRRHIRPVLVFFAMSVAITIYSNLDITMLGFLRDSQEVGYYDVAIKIKVILVNIVTSLGAVLLPRTSYYVEQKMEQEFRTVSGKALEFVAVLAVPMTAAFTIMARECILLLSGSAYLPSVQPMRIIMPTLILIGASNVFGVQMLVPLGKEMTVLWSECAGAAADIVLNAMLIPRYGAAGAAFGTLVAEAVVLAVQIMALKEIARDMFRKLELWKILSATAAAGGVMLLVRKSAALSVFPMLVLTFGVFFLIYGGLLWGMRERILLEILETGKRRLRIGEQKPMLSFLHIKQEYKRKMFLFAYGIYLLSVILFSSKYAVLAVMKPFFPLVRFLAYGLVCLKILLDFLERKYSLKELILIGTVGFVLLISAYVTKDKNLLIYWVFIVASHDVDFQDIIKWSLWVHLAGLALVIGSCYAGILENRIYVQNGGDRLRESLGFQYTTESSNYFFYMILMWVYWRKEKITWKELGLLAAGSFFFFTKTNTKNSFLLGMMALAGAVVLKSVLWLRKYKKGYSVLSVGLAPVLAGSIIAVSVKFDRTINWMQKLNQIITGRLALANEGYQNYGIHIFGQRIEWYGGDPPPGKTYNYVDSSYMQILLNFGVAVLALVLILLVVTGIAIAWKQDTYFLLVFALLVIHSTFDPQLMWIGYDSFVMIYSYVKKGWIEHNENSASEPVVSQS